MPRDPIVEKFGRSEAIPPASAACIAIDHALLLFRSPDPYQLFAITSICIRDDEWLKPHRRRLHGVIGLLPFHLHLLDLVAIVLGPNGLEVILATIEVPRVVPVEHANICEGAGVWCVLVLQES